MPSTPITPICAALQKRLFVAACHQSTFTSTKAVVSSHKVAQRLAGSGSIRSSHTDSKSSFRPNSFTTRSSSAPDPPTVVRTQAPENSSLLDPESDSFEKTSHQQRLGDLTPEELEEYIHSKTDYEEIDSIPRAWTSLFHCNQGDPIWIKTPLHIIAQQEIEDRQRQTEHTQSIHKTVEKPASRFKSSPKVLHAHTPKDLQQENPIWKQAIRKQERLARKKADNEAFEHLLPSWDRNLSAVYSPVGPIDTTPWPRPINVPWRYWLGLDTLDEAIERFKMADEDYQAFLEKASGGGQASTQSNTSEKKSEFTANSVDAGVPATLKGVDVTYTSDADEPFEVVSLKLKKSGKIDLCKPVSMSCVLPDFAELDLLAALSFWIWVGGQGIEDEGRQWKAGDGLP